MSARRDASLMYSNAQALPASAASTNTLDLSDALHQIGQGARKIKVVVSVDTTFAGSLTSADFAFQDSADNTTFADTGIKLSAVAVAKLTAGTLVMAFDLPATGRGPNRRPASRPVSSPAVHADELHAHRRWFIGRRGQCRRRDLLNMTVAVPDGAAAAS